VPDSHAGTNTLRSFVASRDRPALAWLGVAIVAAALLLLPFALAQIGTAWVRITNLAILYVFLALGLNIVVGFAGLLDLGYIAFYAVGAYVYALLASPHFNLHLPFWLILPIGAAVACMFGVLLGAPTLKLRGDYLAIVTLGFGEIIRIFLNNLSQPINITNGPQGVTLIDPFRIGTLSFRPTDTIAGITFTGPIKYYYLLMLRSTCGCRTRASDAPGRRSARTRSRRARWASTRAT
jgi:branched-chain amino acid transport system permease protein